jgi:hypothetical protein
MDRSLGRFIPAVFRDVNVVVLRARELLTLYGAVSGGAVPANTAVAKNSGAAQVCPAPPRRCRARRKRSKTDMKQQSPLRRFVQGLRNKRPGTAGIYSARTSAGGGQPVS